MKHDELENVVQESGGEILRQLLQDQLRLRELEETREKFVRGKDGEKRTHVSKKSRKLVTEVG
ncbi:MAG: ISKra4 family transposase, partial [Deltaproteobacteria bacterium]|nr:ISKra4 family transposase [Deltaproteobacteria bacterium]